MSIPHGNKIKRRILGTASAVLLVGVVFGLFYINALMPIITGYPAKYLCSAVFISNRIPTDVEALDLHFSFIKYTNNEVDFQDSSVTSSFLWGKSKAIYRKEFGCTLIRGTDEATLRAIKFPQSQVVKYNQDTLAWPMGNLLPDIVTGIDMLKLSEIAHKLMIDRGYHGNSFAFMVLYKGIPVAESYQPEFNVNTRFQSWSMAKSVTNALVGIMVKEGKLDIQCTGWNYGKRR